jgi:E3 ubiquitin-protein ligase TRIP12
MKDLEANVVFEHGYNEQSPEKEMVFETICELTTEQRKQLFRFITACERFAIGGLAALTPRVTIVKRVAENGQPVDEALPTASTCSDYFKLPPYSSNTNDECAWSERRHALRFKKHGAATYFDDTV